MAEGVHRKAPAMRHSPEGTCRRADGELPAAFPGHSQVGGRQTGGICIRCVQERREGKEAPRCCSILYTGPSQGREVRAAGARVVLNSRKPERNKNGRKKLWKRVGFHSSNSRKHSTKCSILWFLRTLWVWETSV